MRRSPENPPRARSKRYYLGILICTAVALLAAPLLPELTIAISPLAAQLAAQSI